MARDVVRKPGLFSSARTLPRNTIGYRLAAVVFSLTATLAYADDAPLRKDDPISVVTALLKLDADGHGDAVFPRSSAAALGVDYLNPSLRVAWAKAVNESTAPFYEGDPLTGLAETHGEQVSRIALTQSGIVNVTLALPAYDGVPARQSAVVFVLTHEAGRWQVDDIKYPDALADLQDLADPKVKAALAAYVGSLRALLAHAISR